MNWTTAGDQDNDENTVIIHDLATARAFEDDFQHLYDSLGSWTLCPFEELTSYLPFVSK
jgi:phosphatidylserine/phosphatidylglycerophosphate/cardiolipin synthase-like enzyme